MKRLIVIAGIVCSLAACTQHDANKPDTGGNDPQAPNGQATDSSMNSGNTTNSTTGGDTSMQQQNQ